MSMTRQQILDQAGLRVPHGVQTADLIVIANNIEGELFRTIYKKKTFTSYDVVANLAFYPLDFDIAKVLSVLVGNQEYDWEDNDDREAEAPYAYAYENAVVVVPTPDKNITSGLMVWHYLEPAKWSEENLTSSPDFDGDFHMILVWLIARDLAEIAGQDDKAFNFQRKADTLIKKFEETNPEPELDDIGLA